MGYKAVIFDLDGTLLDTLDDLTDSVNYALNEVGLPIKQKSEIRLYLGNGIGKLIEQSVPKGINNPKFDECFQKFRQYYKEHNMDKTKPYESAIPVMEKLYNEGFKLAIVSNKIDDAVQVLRDKFFSSWVTVAIGDREGLRRKPYGDSVKLALELLDVDKADSVYVGDSEVDFETAKNAGLDCISVLWGFRDKEYLEKIGATNFVNTGEELYSAIVSVRD